MAFKITTLLKGEKEAQQAQQEFEKVCQKGQQPSKIPVFPLKKLSNNPINIIDLLTETNLCSSRSEAKRLISQGCVELNNEAIKQHSNIAIKTNDTLKVGKRKWLEII